MRVVIAGGGNVGSFIADDLVKAGHDVSIVEIDAELVRAAQKLGEPAGVTWVIADACELSELARADLSHADVVAAVTGDDEDNLVISLLAKQEFAVPRVVARVNNPKNEWMFNEMWGVDVSVSTPHLLTALVEEAVSVGSLVRLLSFEGGRARLSEATLHDEAPADGKDIEELGFPRDSTVVAIIRDDHVIVPRGDTVLRAGDEVLVLTSPEAEEDVVRILLGDSKRGETTQS
jgi:trk system potassium uptake protein TrkA